MQIEKLGFEILPKINFLRPMKGFNTHEKRILGNL